MPMAVVMPMELPPSMMSPRLRPRRRPPHLQRPTPHQRPPRPRPCCLSEATAVAQAAAEAELYAVATRVAIPMALPPPPRRIHCRWRAAAWRKGAQPHRFPGDGYRRLLEQDTLGGVTCLGTWIARQHQFEHKKKYDIQKYTSSKKLQES